MAGIAACAAVLAVIAPLGSTASAGAPEDDVGLRSLIVGPTVDEGFLPSSLDQVPAQRVARLVPIDLFYRFRAPRQSLSESFASLDARVFVEVVLMDLTTASVARDSFGLLAKQRSADVGPRKELTLKSGQPAFIITATHDDASVRASANASSGRFVIRVLVDVSRTSQDGTTRQDEANALAQMLLERQAAQVSAKVDGTIVGGTTQQVMSKWTGNLFGFTVVPILAIGLVVAFRDLYFQWRVRRRLRKGSRAASALPPPGQPIDVTAATRVRMKIMRRRRLSAWVIRPILVMAAFGLLLGAPFTALLVVGLAAGAEAVLRRSIERARRSDEVTSRLDDRKYRSTTRTTARGSMRVAYFVGAEFVIVYLVAVILATLAKTFAGAIGDSVIARNLDEGSGSTGPLAFACLAAGVIPYRWASRRSRTRLDQLLGHDLRQPLLLLRSFVDDRLRIRAHRTGRHSLWERIGFRRWDYFEEIVASRMWSVGPVIAIGEPGAEAPALGAARQYFGDDDWKAAVAGYVEQCSIVTLIVGSTEGLRWELAYLRESGAMKRTVFVIPPVTDGRQRIQLLDEAYGWNIASWYDVDRHGVPLVVTVEEGRPVLVTGRRPSDIAYEAAIDGALARLVASISTLPPPRLTSAVPPAIAQPKKTIRRRLKGVGAVGLVVLIQLMAIAVPGLALVEALVKASEVPVIASTAPTQVVHVGAPALDVASDGTALLVSTRSPDGLYLYDTVADQSGQKIPIAIAPSHVAMTDHYLAAISSAATTLWLYDRATARVDTVDLGSTPRALAVVGERFAIVLTEIAEVAIVDPDSRTVQSRSSIGAVPIGAASLNGGLIVADAGSNAVLLVDPESGRETGRIAVGMENPQQVAAAGDTISVISPIVGDVAIIQNGRVEMITLSATASPYDVAVTPDGTVFVSDTATPTVWRIDGRTRKVTALDAGPQPLRLAYVSDTVVVSMPPLAGVGILGR